MSWSPLSCPCPWNLGEGCRRVIHQQARSRPGHAQNKPDHTEEQFSSAAQVAQAVALQNTVTKTPRKSPQHAQLRSHGEEPRYAAVFLSEKVRQLSEFHAISVAGQPVWLARKSI